MVYKRRTEITIESRKLTIIRTSVRESDLVGCQYCGINVSTMPDKYATIVFGLDADHITELTSTGGLHRVVNGSLCGISLAVYFDGLHRSTGNYMTDHLVRIEMGENNENY